MRRSIRFESMTLDHLDRVMEIENNSFSIPFTRDMMLQELTNPRAHYVVALVEETVAGYGGFWQITDEAHIMTIAVAAASRQRGIGTAVMERMMTLARELEIRSMTLEVRVSNLPAIGLYEKMGFVNVGLRKGYYSDNKEDAIIMWNYDIGATLGER